MHQNELRVALFSGNYNYVRDGANQALNRLVDYLERRGIAVRVYSPTSGTPAFKPAGTLVSVPSMSIPRRREYRLALGLPKSVRRDIAAFRPNLIHVSAPDILGYRALQLAKQMGIPAVASIHTRFETYFRYYGMGFLEKYVLIYLRHFYGKCRHVYAPSESFADIIRAQKLADHIKYWGRGVDREQFSPQRRDLQWRRDHGIGDDEAVIAFAGRLVLEKGLSVFAAAIAKLAAQGVAQRVLVIGDGPERSWFAAHLPDSAVFAGFLQGLDLARAYASADLFFNPSQTETFGNVTLEAMASGLPSVCADATGSKSLVIPGVTGFLAAPNDIDGYTAHLRRLIEDAGMRQRMGLAARETSGRYEWDAILSAVVDGYREALGQPAEAPAPVHAPALLAPAIQPHRKIN